MLALSNGLNISLLFQFLLCLLLLLGRLLLLVLRTFLPFDLFEIVKSSFVPRDPSTIKIFGLFFNCQQLSLLNSSNIKFNEYSSQSLVYKIFSLFGLQSPCAEII